MNNTLESVHLLIGWNILLGQCAIFGYRLLVADTSYYSWSLISANRMTVWRCQLCWLSKRLPLASKNGVSAEHSHCPSWFRKTTPTLAIKHYLILNINVPIQEILKAVDCYVNIYAELLSPVHYTCSRNYASYALCN